MRHFRPPPTNIRDRHHNRDSTIRGRVNLLPEKSGSLALKGTEKFFWALFYGFLDTTE